MALPAVPRQHLAAMQSFVPFQIRSGVEGHMIVMCSMHAVCITD